jgi:microcystin-dependent protein
LYCFAGIISFPVKLNFKTMNFFKKKNKTEKDFQKDSGRRNFMYKSIGSVLGLGLVANAANLFADTKSNTGYIYVKRNGEIINDYVPNGGPQPYLGSVMMAGFNFAPQGWRLCDGQLVSISENDALFQLIGTTFGGDGKNTFGLPDLRSRIPVHQGQGPGLSSYIIGQSGGVEEVTLTVNQIPIHNHLLTASTASGSAATPSNNFIAQNADGIDSFTNSSNGTLNTSTMSGTGGSEPHSNIQPYLAIYFSIAMEGIFPAQS